MSENRHHEPWALHGDAALFELMPQLGWVANANGFITYYNRRWYEYTGTTAEQMVGWGWQSVHDPKLLPAVMERWQASIATGEPFEMPFTLRRHDGVFRWFMTHVTPVRDSNGKVMRWIGINTDIEAQKRAEAAAQETHRQVEILFHDAPAAISLLRGPEFVIEFINPRALQIAGVPDLALVLGKPLLVAYPELRGQGFDELLRQVVQTGKPFFGDEVSARIGHGDGKQKEVFLNFVYMPMRDVRGSIDGVSAFGFDVTAQVQARAQAERAVRTREGVLAIVSHDLRNPLGSVLLAAKQIALLADDTESGARTKKSAGVILRGVDRMTRLVGDLLDLSRLEAGQALPLELEKCDGISLAREAVEACEAMAKARGLTLKAELAEGPVYVDCDAQRVQQVFANLLGNAIKFTRDGGSVRVGAQRVNGELRLSVSDTGTGIPEDQLAHIFEPYWQAGDRRKEGIGLGLSIAKAIVDAHGGRIWVDAVMGAGSSFYFTLPSAR